MDPHAVLGVDVEARPEDIEAAYARRCRLHVPDAQSGPDERAAAERYQAELADAYRALLGAAPPAPAAPGVGSPHEPARAGRTPTAARPTPARGVLVVLGTLVAAYLALQIPVGLGLGVTGLVLGVVAAVGIVIAVLVHEHGRD